MTRALILGWMLGTIFPALAVGMVVTASIGGFILPLFLFTTVFTWFFISGAILLT